MFTFSPWDRRGFFMACFQLGVTHPPQQPLASISQVFSSESSTMEVAMRDVETAPRIKFTSPKLPWGSCFLFGCFFKLTFGRNCNILSFPSAQMYRRERSGQLGTWDQLEKGNFLHKKVQIKETGTYVWLPVLRASSSLICYGKKKKRKNPNFLAFISSKWFAESFQEKQLGLWEFPLPYGILGPGLQRDLRNSPWRSEYSLWNFRTKLTKT